MAELPIVKSPLLQTINGVTRKVHPETEASQVKLSDGNTVEQKITALSNATSGKAVTHVVNNIAARDALTGISVGDQAYVKDATGDNTVTKGAAKYICVAVTDDTPTWDKTSEAESMDMVFKWDDIQGKPDVTPEQINDLQSVIGTMKDHELTVSESTGELLLDGKSVGGKYAGYVKVGPDDEGFGDAVAEQNFAEGALFSVIVDA